MSSFIICNDDVHLIMFIESALRWSNKCGRGVASSYHSQALKRVGASVIAEQVAVDLKISVAHFGDKG
jgi:hypothetical protein